MTSGRSHRLANPPLPNGEALIDCRYVAVLGCARNRDPLLHPPFAVGYAALGKITNRAADRREAIQIRLRYVTQHFADSGRVSHRATPFARRQRVDFILQRMVFGFIGLRSNELGDILRPGHARKAARENHLRHALGSI